MSASQNWPRNSKKTAPSPSTSPNTPEAAGETTPASESESLLLPIVRRDGGQLEREIEVLLADERYAGHPLRVALAALYDRSQHQVTQLERLTSISDGYQEIMRARSHSISERYEKQLRQLQKIVRISDRYQDMLQGLNDALKIASTHDKLTGLPNRRFMAERLQHAVTQLHTAAHNQRPYAPFSVALVDIDHFKNINDSFGHDVGDAVLIEIARSLTSTLRTSDMCARWGGEEFLVLLPRTIGKDATKIGERLGECIAALHDVKGTHGIQLSASIGVAEHDSEASVDDTIKRADTALYEAKRTGRARVVLAE